MKLIIGILIVASSVVGGYLMAHGKLAILWQPAEYVVICGAAFGAFIIANPGGVIKRALMSFPVLIKGSKYDKAMYMELLALMYELFLKARKEGVMALESHIDEPSSSDIFSKYPRVAADHHAMEFLTDYLRLIVGGNMNAFELENLMDIELETHHADAMKPGDALTAVGDALPGFGIVAAVLGVIITMGSIGGDPAVLGAHVGAALVGTFLGILLSYGFVGPMGTAAHVIAEEESKFLSCIKVCIMATLNGYPPPVAVEFGRKAISHEHRPGFAELEEYVKG